MRPTQIYIICLFRKNKKKLIKAPSTADISVDAYNYRNALCPFKPPYLRLKYLVTDRVYIYFVLFGNWISEALISN